ncbi:uncharacterized protein METZ01_LOCUS508405, partial [marine metagenome]
LVDYASADNISASERSYYRLLRFAILVTKVTRGTHEVAINSQAVNQRPVATLSWFFLFERGLCGPLTSHFWFSCYALALTS